MQAWEYKRVFIRVNRASADESPLEIAAKFNDVHVDELLMKLGNDG